MRTFQIPRPLSRMTVMENMLLPPKSQIGESLPRTFFRLKEIETQELANKEKASELLEFHGLSGLRNEPAGNLSTGQMKLLELARALMIEPEIMLLDEPLAGVNPTLASELIERIIELHKKGMTFLIVEHNMEAIMRISEKIYALDKGEVIAEGTPKEIKSNERVLDAYLGR